MTRRPRRHSPAEPVADLGPRIRMDRGEVVAVMAADPDAPSRTIRRAKAVWAPDVLLANGTIDRDAHAAATRLHDAYALGVLGARDRLEVYIDRVGAPAGFADARLAAATDYARAVQAVGQRLNGPLNWCVIGYGSVAGYAAHHGWNPHRAQGYLLGALARLAEHYEHGA